MNEWLPPSFSHSHEYLACALTFFPCRSQVLEAVTSRAEEAETIRDHMVRVKDRAIALVEQIACDKQLAEQKLELARPALEMAEAALNTIKPAHIGQYTADKRQTFHLKPGPNPGRHRTKSDGLGINLNQHLLAPH